MRDLTKSMMTFPWAISMFGVQQMANMMSPPPEGRVAGTSAALDRVTEATEEQLDGWMKQTYKLGNTVQRSLVDMMMLKMPSIDQGALMRAVAEFEGNPLFQAGMKYGAPPLGWLDSFLVAPKDRPAVYQEFEDKLSIIQLVTQVRSRYGLDSSNAKPLTSLVDRAAGEDSFPRLWVIEGLGNYYGDHAVECSATPRGLLTEVSMDPLPSWSFPMLHAGIGMSFAKSVLKELEPTSPAEVVRAAITSFGSLCRNSSRPGYAGAALESLGLATRTLYPSLVALLDTHIPSVDEELHGYFWHGAGRAMYFEPMNIAPQVNAPWRVVAALNEVATYPFAFNNALAGVCWAITVVNMQKPIVMEAFLRHHGPLADRNDAFSNGVVSSMMMRFDTTPGDRSIEPFIHYDGQVADAAVGPLWRNLVTAPCERALQQTYPKLRDAHDLQQLFHYVPGSR